MVSHDSLVRAEKRLGVPAVIGRFHKAPRQLQDDYELDEKVGWNHGGLAEQHIFWGVCNLYASLYTHTPLTRMRFICFCGTGRVQFCQTGFLGCLALLSQPRWGVLCGTSRKSLCQVLGTGCSGQVMQVRQSHGFSSFRMSFKDVLYFRNIIKGWKL